MRKSFDTLCGIVRSWHGQNGCDKEQVDPLSGHFFVFCNRRRDRIKILFFDGSGLVLVAKRLERGSFSWPTTSTTRAENGEPAGKHLINQNELALLLGGVDLSRTSKRRWWRKE